MKKKKKPAPKKKTKAKKAKAVVKTKKAKKLAAPKKAVKKKAPKKKKSTPRPPEVEGILLGRVEDYFAKVGVVALTLKAPLQTGDKIRIKGHTTDYTQVVDSMQIEHAPVSTAKKGDSIGIKVADRARRTDRVYKVS